MLDDEVKDMINEYARNKREKIGKIEKLIDEQLEKILRRAVDEIRKS